MQVASRSLLCLSRRQRLQIEIHQDSDYFQWLRTTLPLPLKLVGSDSASSNMRATPDLKCREKGAGLLILDLAMMTLLGLDMEIH